jgi:hypothetical protein
MVVVARFVLIGFLAGGLLTTIVVGAQSSPSSGSVGGPLCIHSFGRGDR